MINAKPDPFEYVSFPVMDTKEDFMREIYNKGFSTSPENSLYAIFDRIASPGKANIPSKYAGVISLSGTNIVNAVTEMGIVVFPEFQRTHVATNAIGLLLLRTLDPASEGGLGLRRVEWQTHAGNAASRRTALRMGFEFEGIAKWQRTVPNAKVGLSVGALEKRNGTTGELQGRHTANFAIVWDEWDEKRSKVVALMGHKPRVE
jgi:RimJ/RimL family protein N-acetyltransferase